MSQLADDLKASLVLIGTPHRWIKKSFHTPGMQGQDCYCMFGAVKAAVWEKQNGTQRLMDALEALRVQIEADSGSSWQVISYNDLPGTTHADVVRVFKRAIRASEAPTISREQFKQAVAEGIRGSLLLTLDDIDRLVEVAQTSWAVIFGAFNQRGDEPNAEGITCPLTQAGLFGTQRTGGFWGAFDAYMRRNTDLPSKTKILIED